MDEEEIEKGKNEFSSFLFTYAFGPGTKVKTPEGEGTLIGVYQPWNVEDMPIMYCCAVEENDKVRTLWVNQLDLMLPSKPEYQVLDAVTNGTETNATGI